VASRASRAREREAADRLHSAAIHLLRRARRTDPLTGVSAAQLSALSVLVFGGPCMLGALAAATGILLSLSGSLALARYSFDSSFSPHLGVVVLLFAGVCGLTILIGLYNSRSVLNKPPLEILRNEV